ncbi:MAG: hypothetical protein GX956_07985 [Firmicutes bacterium]|nr:hypothetical protein [Bacillota bacterium]
MSNYLSHAFASWLTPIYLIVLAIITVAVMQNVLKEEKALAQIVGGIILIPLVLRLLLIK